MVAEENGVEFQFRGGMPTRQYRDPGGTEWEVFEVHRLNDRPNSVRPALSSGWLAFVSAGEKRRLPQYPAGWMELPDSELEDLLVKAFLAPDPAFLASRTGGERAAPERGDIPRHVDRRRQPRPPSPPLDIPRAAATELSSAPAVTTTVNMPPPAIGAGLPVPPPSTTSSTLGVVGVEDLVRIHARQARTDGATVIQGMIGVKRALGESGEDVSPNTLKKLRKVFVDEFYFSA